MIGSGTWEMEQEDGGDQWRPGEPEQVLRGLYIAADGDGGLEEAEDGSGYDVPAEVEPEVGSDGDADVEVAEDVPADIPPEVGADADGDVGAEADIEVGADSDADAEAEVEAEADVGFEAEAEAEADAGPVTWYDTTSGLLWQDPPSDTLRTWDASIVYCNGLVLGGHDDWYMPSISQLRSFIRGCTDTMTGGACGVTDSCLSSSCLTPIACDGCTGYAGPAPPEGCYWDLSVSGSCSGYWSSSTYTTDPSHAWFVTPAYARPGHIAKSDYGHVRCVRYGI